MEIGYTMMSEHAGPQALVRHVQLAEQAGFDFSVISDHYFPWLDEQGHSSYAWAVLGAAAHATERIPLMSFVTCPTRRYHPVVVAQKAATVQLLSDGRFTLGLGAGENLNEHVVGGGWPSPMVRHEMLTEAINIIKKLFQGGYVHFDGEYFHAEAAKLWDLPAQPPPIAIAASGGRSARLAGSHGDALVAVTPDRRVIEDFHAAGGVGKACYGQLALSFDDQASVARRRAWEQFRWFGGGWNVNAELRGTSAFASASQYVTEEAISSQIPCGNDPGAVLEKVRAFAEAGFTHLALLQVGGDRQEPFIDWATQDLLEAARRV